MAMGAIKRSDYSIMGNSGFGTMIIYREDGAVITIPQAHFNKDTGKVKSGVRKLLNDITRENIIKLEGMGISMDVRKVA